MGKCVVCSKEFESNRKDAQFCSGACRVKSSRQKVKGVIFKAVATKALKIDPKDGEVKYGDISVDKMVDDVVKDAIRVVMETNEPVPEGTISVTPLGEDRVVWDNEHPQKNLTNGYFHIGQTKEEYIDNIPEEGFLFGGVKCEHKKGDFFGGKCLECGELLHKVNKSEQVGAVSKDMWCKKHHGSLKVRCGCK
jgi:predicted nucleic acid-binding Zn ribbon protein